MLKLLKKHGMLLAGLTIFLTALSLNAASEKISACPVLYVNSYNPSQKWSRDVFNGFWNTFQKHTQSATVDIVNLNCRPANLLPSPEAVRHLKTILQDNRYSLILAEGKPAANLFLEKKLIPPPQTAVVFCGYDTPGKAIAPLPPRMTGLLTPPTTLMSIEFGLRLFPRTRTVAILTGTEQEEVNIQQAISKEIARFPGIRFLIINGHEFSTEKMLFSLQSLPGDSFLVLSDWPDTAPAPGFLRVSLLQQIRDVYDGPIFSPSDKFPGEDILGGVMTIGSEHGQETAMMALRLLSSKDRIAELPRTGSIRYVMHYPSMDKYHVASGLLPQGTLLLEPPKSAWLRFHPWAVVTLAFLLLCGLLVSVVLFLNRQRALHKQQTIYDALPVRITVVDANEKIRFHQVHRKDSNVTFTPKCLDDLSPAAQAIFRDPIRKVLETGDPLSFNYTLNRRRRHVEFQRLPKNLFGINSVLWISTDINELEKTRMETVQLAERFQLTLRSIGEAVIVTDANENITLVNTIAEKLTGYTQEELIGRKLSDKIILAEFEIPKKERISIQRQLTTGRNPEPIDHLDIISKDGTRRHVEGSLTPIFDPFGELTGSVMIFRDITEEYEKRIHIFTQKNLLEAAADFAGITYFRLDKAENRIILLQNREKFWETSSDEFPQSMREWIHPDDLPNFKNEWNSLFWKEKDSLRITYRGGKNRQYHYFEMRCRQTINPENSHEEIFGIIRDIHEEKAADLALHNANQLIQSVMEHIPCLLYIKDFEHENRYLFISRYFLQQTGLSSTAIIGRNDYEIFSRELADQYLRADQQAMNSKQELNLIEPFVTADGTTHTLQTRKLCIERETGNLLFGISFDITDIINNRNELQTYAQQEKMINSCLRSLIRIEDDEKALHIALHHACEYFKATHCYVFSYDYENARTVPFHEYVSEGHRPLLESGSTVPFSSDDPWRPIYEKHKSFLADRTDAPEIMSMESEWKPILMKNGIKSFAFHGIWLEKKLWGSFGVLFQQDYHTFTPQDKAVLSALTNMIEIILERRKKRSELTRSEFEKRLIMDTIRIPILLLDPELNLVRINNAALNISGKSEKEIYENPCHSTFSILPDSPEDCPAHQARADGQAHMREMTIKGRNYQLTAYPIQYENKLIYILVTMIDITDSKAIQQQLTRALMEAQSSAKAKSFFLATISHELRTPLNAVIGFSELLQKDSLPREERKDALQSIHYAGNALLNLINDVLDLSKIESEQMNIVPQPTNLQKLLEEIVSIFRYKAEEKKLVFESQCPEDMPVLILDTLRLRQILLNLVGNAFKFTEKGSVSLSIKFNKVNPAKRRGDLVLSVTDTGIGISKESQEKIFMPFVQQYDARDANIYKGTGLGLAISQRLSNCMGGSIQLESEPGKGSKFTLYLPNLEYENNRNSSESTTSQQSDPLDPNHPRKKVLLVDDVPMNLKVLAAMLKQLGFETQTASSGQEALNSIKQEPPDIVLTDLWMPGMGGVELLKNIRKENRFHHMILVAITADTEADKNFSLDGFSGILLKPVTLDKLKTFLVSLAGDIRESTCKTNEFE